MKTSTRVWLVDHRRRRGALMTALLAALVLVLTGCGGEGDRGADTDAPDQPSDEQTDPDPDADDGAAREPTSREIQVFFTNLERGAEGEVYPVGRTTTDDDLPTAAVRELLAGPTAAERDQGYSSWFSPDTAGMLRSVRVEDKVAHVDFEGALRTTIPGASTSAGSLVLLAELDATTRQFPDITDSVYSLAGDVNAFYDWLQLVPPDGDAAPPTDGAADPEVESGTATVEVYFTNTDLGSDTEVFAVERDVELPRVLSGALQALLEGPTAAEREQGYWSWFSEETAGMLLSVRLDAGIAEVSFDPALRTVIPNASTSAGSTALLGALDATTLQFPTVDDVVYSFDGDVEAFYEWLQRGPPA
jgi:spore germination protein GerM